MRALFLGLVGATFVATTSAAAQASRGPRISVGPTQVRAGTIQGNGLHLAALVPVGPRIGHVDLTAQVRGFQATVSGRPSSCVMVDAAYCLGRTERVKGAAATLGVEGGDLVFDTPIYVRGEAGAYLD